MPEADLTTILKGAKIFKGLSDDQIAIVSDSGKVVTFDINDTIINEGQTGHPFFIVIKGQVEVVLPKETGVQSAGRATRIKLSQLEAGDCIGEYSLIDKEPASASVVAIEPCVLFEIAGQNFEKIVDAQDFLAKTVYKNILLIMIKRARDNNRELDICYH
jgi:CRP-like cAMP-binding protein